MRRLFSNARVYLLSAGLALGGCATARQVAKNPVNPGVTIAETANMQGERSFADSYVEGRDAQGNRYAFEQVHADTGSAVKDTEYAGARLNLNTLDISARCDIFGSTDNLGAEGCGINIDSVVKKGSNSLIFGGVAERTDNPDRSFFAGYTGAAIHDLTLKFSFGRIFDTEAKDLLGIAADYVLHRNFFIGAGYSELDSAKLLTGALGRFAGKVGTEPGFRLLFLSDLNGNGQCQFLFATRATFKKATMAYATDMFDNGMQDYSIAPDCLNIQGNNTTWRPYLHMRGLTAFEVCAKKANGVDTLTLGAARNMPHLLGAKPFVEVYWIGSTDHATSDIWRFLLGADYRSVTTSVELSSQEGSDAKAQLFVKVAL